MTEEDLKTLNSLIQKAKANQELAFKQYPTKERAVDKKYKGGLVRYNPETDSYDYV